MDEQTPYGSEWLSEYHDRLRQVAFDRLEVEGQWTPPQPPHDGCKICGDPVRPCPNPSGPPVPCTPWHHTTGGHDHDAEPAAGPA